MFLLACLTVAFISEDVDFISMDEDVYTHNNKTTDNAADNGAPNKDEDESDDDDINDGGPEKLIQKTSGYTTAPIHL